MSTKVNKNFLFGFLLNTLIEECHVQHKSKKKKILKKVILFQSSNRRRNIPKNRGFFKIIESYPNDVFKGHFRMEKATFEKLILKLKPSWENAWTGRPPKSLREGLYITIWKLGNQCSYRDIADRFGIGRGTAYNCVIKITSIIYRRRKEFIKWPSSSEYFTIIEEFQNLTKRPFPFVVGCVDGSHIPIPAPSQNTESYYNRKGFHSLLLQAVCDANCIFTDVFFGIPGRAHDAAVWRMSNLGKALAEKLIELPEGAHLLGDSAYPLAPYLMVPYRDHGYLNETEKKFNTCLSKTRVSIEQAFGILKSKFRILKYLDIQNLNQAKFIVLTCVAFHNFIIKCEGLHLDCESNNVISENDTFETLEYNTNTTSEDAKIKRDNIANLLSG